MEASERIRDEVGNDAEIIWGTVIDDQVGEEMRVTVIATGIGGSDAADRVQEVYRPKEVVREFKPRGKVRDITPEDMNRKTRMNDQGRIEPEEVVEQDTDGKVYRHYGLVIDQDDLEIPTFLRRSAD